MEEDIKILEERITMLKRHIKYYEESDCKTDRYYQLVKECKALENLLTRYKQQKEELESIKEIYYTQKEMDNVMERYRKLVKNSIPKSKIKEKIQEITNMRDTTITSEGYNILNGEIVVLQDLLEEE